MKWPAAVLAVAGLLAGAGDAQPQGSCTVPHGSPASPTNGFVLTEAPGHGWLQVTLYHLDTRNQYDADARSRPYFADGHLVTTSVVATAVVGVLRGVDVWGQLPVHRLVFEEVSGDRRSTGLGDPRFYVRVGPDLFGVRPGALPLGVAFRAGVKLPGQEFPVDNQLIPLTEGQRDWEALVELGKRFESTPFYAMGWAGYRWREENVKRFTKPGNERFAYLAVGGALGSVSLRIGVQGLWGEEPLIQGYQLPTAQRRMLEFLPIVGHKLGPGEAQLGTRLPVSGRNLPGGTAVSLGYFLAWGDRTPVPLADLTQPSPQR